MLNRLNILPYPLLLLFLSLILFIPGVAQMPVIERDEAHFAQASRQMLQSKQFFQVHFQNTTRFQKPPGINWLQAAAVNSFSKADASAIGYYRIPSTLGAVLAVLLTFYFTRRIFNANTAALAAALLASSFLLLIEAHMAVIDAMLLASVVLMQGSLWIIYRQNESPTAYPQIWICLFWVAMSVGFVLKGVSPLFAAATLLWICIKERNLRLLRSIKLVPGLLFFMLVNGYWLFEMNQAEHSNYLMQMLHKDLLPKLQGGHESHGKPPLFHLAILPLTFWPASLFLIPACLFAYRNRAKPDVQFLLAWFVPSWIFFECMPTKLPQYVLPLFPALAIAMALAVEEYRQTMGSIAWLRILQGMWGILSLALALAFIGISWLLMQELSLVVIALSLCVAIISSVGMYYAMRGQYRQAAVSLLIMAVFSYPLLFQGWLPSLKPLWLAENISSQIDKDKISRENPLLVVGFEEPGLVFSLNTDMVAFTDLNAALTALANNPHRLVLMDDANWYQIKTRYPDDTFELQNRISGFNYSKGKWVNLNVLAAH